ncbi:golgin subfamily A member 6-like protein 22 isoform X1 [Alosa sapidissima]|uniref:golgin subfamily A member 6-like protein 22 isoform X1 n=1 Tax=Alosa sapidissima TaxID=34773 RepID=UPI001C08AC67|nr:golgin subfamily A member 6-like protein 22 isoform X1 [Alosa sapidissima]
MEDSGFQELRYWIQDQITVQEARPEVMGSNTCRSSKDLVKLNPANPRRVAWNDDDSDDSATYAFPTADRSKKTQALTGDQKGIFNYVKEKTLTGGLRQQKRVSERRQDHETQHPTEGRGQGVIRQRGREKQSDIRRHKHDLEVQDLEIEDTTEIEHLLGSQCKEEGETHQLKQMTSSSLKETEKLSPEEPDQSGTQEKMKVKQPKMQGGNRQRQKELEQIKYLERDERDRERLSKVEKEERQREKERLEGLVIQRMRQKEMQHNEMKKQKKRQRPNESKRDMKTFGETEGQSETLTQWLEKATWLDNQQEKTERQLRGRVKETNGEGNGRQRTEAELNKARRQREESDGNKGTKVSDLREERLRENNPNWVRKQGCREERDTSGLEEMRKMLNKLEQEEDRCREVEDNTEAHQQQVESETDSTDSLQMYRRNLWLLREKHSLTKLDEEVETERHQEAKKHNLSEESETDSQSQEGEQTDSQTDSQTDRQQEVDWDKLENDILSLTDAEERSECSMISGEDEVRFQSSFQFSDRDRSVRRRIIGWVNDKMKERYQRKIVRTMQRENHEGQETYISGFALASLGLGRICTRAEREQEKRIQLLKAEARRQDMESKWLQWEAERKRKKEERKAREREEKSRAQLAWILQQNEKADRNLDRYNSQQMYTSANTLEKEQIIGWDGRTE